MQAQEADQLQKYTWPPMPMDIRLILKSLEVKYDSQVAPRLIDLIGAAEYLVADKGYDSEKIREYAKNHAMIAVIPRKSNSAKTNPEFDAYLYKLRH